VLLPSGHTKRRFRRTDATPLVLIEIVAAPSILDETAPMQQADETELER